MDFFILLGRFAIAFVFLFAAYLNAKAENRGWLVSHTALLFPASTPKALIQWAAFIGVASMFVGGVLVAIGWWIGIGAAVLIAFTLLGYLQHRQEVVLATRLADDLERELKPLLASAVNAIEIRQLLLDLRISAFSGQFSSGLKNWGLIGGLLVLGFVTGAGRYSIDALFATSRF